MDKGSRRIKSYVLTLLMLSVFLLKPSYNLMAANRKLVTHKEINPEILFKEEGEETYKPLTKQSVLSGKVDFIVRLPNGHKGYEYIDYKINGFYHAPAKGPEYKTTIDTTKLPNSWNQLVAIGYNLQLEGAKQVLFKVNNEKEKVIRPKRVEGYPIWKKPIYKRNYIPVLMYHDFQENITKEQESAVVHPKLFEEQIKTLLKNGYIPVDFYDLLLYKQGKGGLPNKPFIITADDGYLSNYTTAYPILKKYNVPATFFVSTRYVGVNLYSPHFTWEQAKEMEESGLIDI